MLDFEDMKQYFPNSVHHKGEFILREYIQCLVLQAIFASPLASKLTFIGGTALRLIYNTQRFSEDLDFDNKGLNLEEWTELGNMLKKELAYMGITVDVTKTRMNDTIFHHNLRFPDLLFKYEISPHKNSILLIKMDSQDQCIKYKSSDTDLNRFDVIDSKIKVMPIDVALSQKFRAFFDREMGRDLFDISSIAPMTKPNYAYLEEALGISNSKQLKDRVLARCEELDITDLEKRTVPFLFKETDVSRIRYFKDYMQQYQF